MGKQAMYILRTPLQQCLHRVRDKGAVTRPCHGKVVGAYVHLDDPFRVHPCCAEHTHERPHQWPPDKSVWVQRLQVEAVQRKIISIQVQRGSAPLEVRQEMVVQALEDIGGGVEPRNHFE